MIAARMPFYCLNLGAMVLGVSLVAAAAAAESTPPASAAVQRFDIGAMDVTGNTLLPQVEIERAVYPHIGPGRSVADVEAARTDLEKAYRARGYDSVVVDIPQQSASSGVIRLAVVEAKLASIQVTGVGEGAARSVRARTPSLREGMVPNLTEAQAELAEANRLPGRQVTPLLKPGKQPGTIDLELKVAQQEPLHGTIQLSNDHSPNTRPLRVLASVRDENLWGLGHTLSATYVVAPEDRSNAEVFAASYLAPIWGSPWSVLVYGYKSNSNVAALGGTNVLGDGYAVGVRGILKLPSKGAFSHSLSFGVDYKDFNEQVTLTGVDEAIRTPIHYLPLTATYSASYAGEKSSLTSSLAVTLGLRPISMGAIPTGDVDSAGNPIFLDAFGAKRGSFNARSNFVHVNLDAEYTRTIGKDFVGLLRFSGQFANGPLISNEQFAAGGLTSVRGYLQSEAIGDDGVAGTAELRSPAIRLGKIVDELRFYGFSDIGYARMLDALPEQIATMTLWSAGVGAKFQLLKYLSGDVSVAFPLTRGVRKRSPYAGFSVKAEY
jgi:hemolysin activation/secretion protein